MDWQTYKSGTDIRGIAVETEKGPVTLTDSVIEAMTDGFLLWLSGKCQKPVSELTLAVGHDCRLSADRIRQGVIKRAAAAGCRVLDCGLASTPSMFMITVDRPVDGSVQITASHHPYHVNGLKFFTGDGGLQGEDITAILELCRAQQHPPARTGGDVCPVDYMTEYAAGLRQKICNGVGKKEEQRPLQGFHIVVDAGNGVGGFFATQVLQPLGADISGSVFLEPDGHFPNHIPNPENPQAMAALQKAVLDSGADFGVIFDTDVDRAGCVDADGREINRNRLVALASVLALKGQEKAVVVTDSVTSDGLKAFIEHQLHGEQYRYKRGYRNVINKAMELCAKGINAPLAMETSGHAAFRDNYFLDDGAYLMTRMIIQLVLLRQQEQTLSDLLDGLEEPAQSVELRFTVEDDAFRSYGEQVLQALEQFARTTPGFSVAPDNREGIRIYADSERGDGWLLLRMSVHDPVMPMNVESRQITGCRKILEQVAPVFARFDALDCSSLTACLCQDPDAVSF